MTVREGEREHKRREEEKGLQSALFVPSSRLFCDLAVPFSARQCIHYTARVLDEALIGRDRDVAEIRKTLASPGLLTVIGPAGIGKTAVLRVALAAARVARIDASNALDEGDLRKRLQQATGAASLAADAASLARWLDAHDCVIALEDVDSLASARAAGELLGSLLAVRPLRIAASSLAPLGVEGERVHRLGRLSAERSRQLFLQSLPRSSDAATAHEGPLSHELDAVVSKLDGLPLAIRLAARRSSVLSLSALATRLERPLEVLRAGNESLERALAASVDSLPADAQVAFAAAAVFFGPFSADAFEAVALAAQGRPASAPAADASTPDPLDLLEALLDHSLVERTDEASAVRFVLRPTIREYGRHRLDGLAERDRVHAAHARQLLEVTEGLAAKTYGPMAQSALNELAARTHEVVSVFDVECTHRPAVAAALWLTLYDAILFRGVIAFDDPRFDAAVAAADRANDLRARVRTRVLRARAGLELSEAQRAERDLQAALELTSAAGDRALEVEVRRSLGWTMLALGRPRDAIDVLEKARDSSISLRDTRSHADALAALGMAEMSLGNLDEARGSLELARALHVNRGDAIRRDRVTEMLSLFPGAASRAEDVDLSEAAARYTERGQSWRAALSLLLLSSVQRAEGQEPLASDALVRARAAARSAGLEVLEEVFDALSEPRGEAPAWRVGPEARWLEALAGERIDLARHGSLRRVLSALVSARIETPGRAISSEGLLAAGWPGERVLHDAGMLRVYSAIRRLRRLGLHELLLTRDDGYLLDPESRIASVSE